MAQGFQIEGKLHQVNETQTFDSGFTKREFVIETVDQYPQMIKFELIKERTTLVDPFNQGDSVNVHFDIRGNEYQGKFYVNLNCWRLEGAGSAPGGGGGGVPAAQPQPAAQASSNPSESYPSEAPSGFSDDDDIPF